MKKISYLVIFSLLSTIHYSSLSRELIPLAERHSSINTHSIFDFSGNHFEAYVDYERNNILHGRTDINQLSEAERQVIIDGNAPFLMEPSEQCTLNPDTIEKKGILLIHGLSDSPYTMQALAKYFQSHCFLVYVALLPGHGIKPGGLVNADWREWSKATEYLLNLLKKEVDTLYMGGFSTGATLAMHAASVRSDIHSLFLFAPAIDVKPIAQLAHMHKLISWIFPRLAWLDILEDKNPYKYESFSLNAVTEIYHLTQAMQKRVKEKNLNTNIFIVASWEDTTVDTPKAIEFFNDLKSDKIKVLLFSQDGKKVGLQEKLPNNTNIINSGKDNNIANIRGISHIAIPISPNDNFYGSEAHFKECKHYFGSENLYRLCQQGKATIIGEVTNENKASGLVQRLSYNPYFDEMLHHMDIFLHNGPKKTP